MISPRPTTLRRRLLEAPVLSVVLIAAVIAAAVSSPPGAGSPEANVDSPEGHAYSSAARVLLYRSRGAAVTEWDPLCRESSSRESRDQSGEQAAALADNERWAVYGPSALAPLAVSLDSWREDMQRGMSVSVALTVINDTHRDEMVDVRLHAVLPNGELVDSSRMHRETAAALARTPLSLDLALPEGTPFLLIAELKARNPDHPTVWGRRKIGFPDAGAAVPDPPFRSVCCRVG